MAQATLASTQGMVAFVALLCVSFTARSDAVRIDGEWREEVYVVTGERMHYVLVPEDGSVLNVRPGELGEHDLRLLPDGPAREALHDAWKRARAEADSETEQNTPSRMTSNGDETPQTAVDTDSPPTLVLRGNPPSANPASPPPPSAAPSTAPPRAPSEPPRVVVDPSGRGTGMVRHVRLKNIPLGEALKVILRPLGLDYVNTGSYLFISTPERLRREPLERLETRTYETKAGLGGSLPKIVVQQ